MAKREALKELSQAHEQLEMELRELQIATSKEIKSYLLQTQSVTPHLLPIAYNFAYFEVEEIFFLYPTESEYKNIRNLTITHHNCLCKKEKTTLCIPMTPIDFCIPITPID